MGANKFSLQENGHLGRNIVYAVVAQGVSLVSSVMMSLLVPKILGIEDYAYWQLFVLYSEYVGLALFGVHDGINLRLGGAHIEEIDWRRVKAEFEIVLCSQLAIGGIAASIVLFSGDDGSRSIVLLLVLIYGLVLNPASFLFYILRAANLPNIYSTGSLISGALWIVLLFALIVLRPVGFWTYIICYIVSQACSSVYCYLHFLEPFRCKRDSLRGALNDIKLDCSAGLKVTVAYYAGALVVGGCRMIVDARWGIEAFGKFSLSVSLVNFLLAFMAQVSMIIFPIVRRMDAGSRAKTYGLLRGSLAAILPLIYVVYYPGCWLLGLWLPEYADSLSYLAIILPVCIFDCKMQLLINTYLKTLRKENALLWLNVATLAVSILLDLICAFALNDLILTAVAMTVAIALRSLISEIYLGRFLDVLNWRMLISELVLAAWFMMSAYILSSFIMTLGGVIAFYIVNHEDISEFLGFIKRKTAIS
jgi:O-antigen/teichoic acid export membrane protein